MTSAQGEQSNSLPSSSSSSPSSVLVMVVTGDGVLATAGIGVGEGVPVGGDVGERVPVEVGTLTGAFVSSGAGAGVPDRTGQGSQVEQSPQLRQIWPRPKSDEGNDQPRTGRQEAGGRQDGQLSYVSPKVRVWGRRLIRGNAMGSSPRSADTLVL